MMILGAGIGSREVALSSHRLSYLHPRIPRKEFLDGCTMAMPQVYWVGSHDPAAQLAKSAEYRTIKALPVVPTALSDNGWSPTCREITELLTESKNSHQAANIFRMGRRKAQSGLLEGDSIVSVVAANGDVNVSM